MVFSENKKAALVCARAGFWLNNPRNGSKSKDLDLFADLILDQTQVECSKIMTHERGDALITIPSAHKDDKQEIIKILLAAQNANDS